MAYIPSPYSPVTDKTQIRWLENGELGDELTLNRPIDDLANMVLTVTNENTTKNSARLATDGNINYGYYTSTNIVGKANTGSLIATINNGSTVVTLDSAYTTNLIKVGTELSGAGIQVGAVVADITSSNEFVMSLPATMDAVDTTIDYTQTIDLLFIDGIRVSTGDRILVKDQSIGVLNGIYEVVSAGSDITPFNLKRTADASVWNQMPSSIITIQEGITNDNTIWICTVDRDAGIIGTDPLLFEGLGGSGQMLGKAKIKVFSYNAQIVSEDITVPSNVNSSAVGPIVIESGFSVTIEDGARVAII